MWKARLPPPKTHCYFGGAGDPEDNQADDGQGEGDLEDDEEHGGIMADFLLFGEFGGAVGFGCCCRLF